MKRSSSERKLEKARKKEERKTKSRSVHFDANGEPEMGSEQPISIIGKNGNEEFSDSDELKRSRSGSGFFSTIKSKMKKKKEVPGGEGDDEGFESDQKTNGDSKDSTLERSAEAQTEEATEAPLADGEDLSDFIGVDANKKVENPTVEGVEDDVKLKKEDESTNALQEEEVKAAMKTSPYFHIDMTIISGKELIAMDRGGTSDPYVKVMQGDVQLKKTQEKKKTLTPEWNEQFDAYIPNKDLQVPLLLQVYDKDLAGKDDFMGQVELKLDDCELNKASDHYLFLLDGEDETLMKKLRKKKTLGSILIRIKITPISKEQYKEIAKREKLGRKGGKDKTWSSIVHIVLVQARELMAMDAGTSSDPYCKISIGKESYKSKVIQQTLNPKWRESFDFYWYEDGTDQVYFDLYDSDIGGKDDFMGRISVNLKELTQEVSHNLWKPVENGTGQINCILTISGTTEIDSPSNIQNWEPSMEEEKLIENYSVSKTLQKVKDVGHLTVKVLKAQGLHSADLGGKSDPFCVVELTNTRYMTHTEYKTLMPVWQKAFTFDVQDINEVLEVTVFDEDSGHKFEFLGKIFCPLLRIQKENNMGPRWYNLKDKTLRKRAKGEKPQILLDMNLHWNPLRASIRTFNPKSLKYEDKSDTKFKFATFNKNVKRVKQCTAGFDPELAIRELQSIMSWENKGKTIGVYIGIVLGVWMFEPWMITLGLLFPFLQHIILLTITGGWGKSPEDSEEEDDVEEVSKDKEESEKKSLKEKMDAMQEIALMIQGHLGFLAHCLECVQNIFNFSVPFLSWLLFCVIIIVTIVLYNIPLRVLLILAVTNKFFKKLFKPNAINNNELVDFISRVPDNEELLNYKELKEVDELDKKTRDKIKKNAARDNDII